MHQAVLGGSSPDRLSLSIPEAQSVVCPVQIALTVFFLFIFSSYFHSYWFSFHGKLASWSEANGKKKTLSGGSLGSCVDEERSQLRELM